MVALFYHKNFPSSLTTILTYRENAEPFYYHVKERDEHGNVLEDSLYDGDQLMVRTVYEYAVE